MAHPVERADIQGLRALAVLAVVAFHAFPGRLPGGFVGVDVFFVISGHVITASLRRRIEAGRYSLAAFYGARARRLAPALLVLLAAVLGLGYALLPPKQLAETARNAASTLVFASNHDFYRLSGYFDGPAALRPLLHTWSLSVEAQIYLVYPLLLPWLVRRTRRSQGLILAGAILAGLLASQILLMREPSLAFYAAPARLFEFLIGALPALGLVPRPKAALDAATAVGAGLAALAACALLFSAGTPFPGLMAAAPCLAAGLILWGAEEDPVLGRRLGAAPLRLIGDASYSLYLWHWPLLAFARLRFGPDLPLAVALASLLLAAGAAGLSVALIERPMRRNAAPGRLLAAGSVAVLGLSALLYGSGGALWRVPRGLRPVYAAAEDYNRRRSSCHGNGRVVRPYAGQCRFGAPQSEPDIAVWGDSHAAEMAAALGARAAAAGRAVVELSTSACPPALGFAVPESHACPAQNDETLSGLVADAALRLVILATNAERYGGGAGADALEAGTEASVRRLRAAGKDVVLVAQVPIMPLDPPAEVGRALMAGRPIEALGIDAREAARRAAAWNGFLAALAERTGSTLVSPSARLCDDRLCHMAVAGVGVLYFNADHLSVTGAAFVLAPLADRLYGRPPAGAGPTSRLSSGRAPA